MKRSTEIAKQWGKRGRRSSREGICVQLWLAMCVHALASSAGLFQRDEWRLKILKYETGREREISKGSSEDRRRKSSFSIHPQRKMGDLILRGLHLFVCLFVSHSISVLSISVLSLLRLISSFAHAQLIFFSSACCLPLSVFASGLSALHILFLVNSL